MGVEQFLLASVTTSTHARHPHLPLTPATCKMSSKPTAQEKKDYERCVQAATSEYLRVKADVERKKCKQISFRSVAAKYSVKWERVRDRVNGVLP